MAMTGAIVQNEFQNKRYVYSMTLRKPVSRRDLHNKTTSLTMHYSNHNRSGTTTGLRYRSYSCRKSSQSFHIPHQLHSNKNSTHEMNSHITIPIIRPMPMNKQQPLQKSKLRNSIIGRIDSLKTFFSRNTNPNISRLDHTNIIGSISNREGHRTQTFLHQPDNQSFLEWGHSTTNHTFALHSKSKQ